MEENKINTEDEKLINSDKLSWTTPKLVCLDKGKTEGGSPTHAIEDDTYNWS